MARVNVAVVYKSLPQYRRRFFELLRERLAAQDVEFTLVYGQPGAKDAAKKDVVDLPWAVRIENRIFRIGRRELFWQPCLPYLRGTDLVIVEQASKLLVNYVLMAQQVLGIRKFAFWGHGKNFQGQTASGFGEAVKRWISRLPHWWFAYNELSARVVESLGYPSGRITHVQNAIDTRQLIDAAAGLTVENLESVRLQLGLQGNNVAIYCGAMYPEKCLDFLLDACVKVRERVPDFEMIFVGGGPEQSKVYAAAERYDWIRYVGPKFDEAKVPYFMLSKLYLMPGLVGLGILDSFALSTPLVTTAIDFHSPEIDYLVQDRNGVITSHDTEQYVAAVVSLLEDEPRRQQMIAGCREGAQRYTVEAMVENFAQGVLQALRG